MIDRKRIQRLLAHRPEELADLMTRLLDRLVKYKLRPECREHVERLTVDVMAVLLSLEADLTAAHISHRQRIISWRRALGSEHGTRL